jgi:uncharacterized membrane protein YadS
MFMMDHKWMKIALILSGLVAASSAQAQVDSYRFMHVTIDTPWYIFIFLLMGVFVPFVLMAVLAWKNAIRKSKREAADSEPINYL